MSDKDLRKKDEQRKKLIEKWEFAKIVYQKIVGAIIDVEDSHNITCELPSFIEIDGTKFYKSQLHLFSRPPEIDN